MSNMQIHVFNDLESAKQFKLPKGYAATCGTPRAVSGDFFYGSRDVAEAKCNRLTSNFCSDVVILIAEKA